MVLSEKSLPANGESTVIPRVQQYQEKKLSGTEIATNEKDQSSKVCTDGQHRARDHGMQETYVKKILLQFFK